MKQWWTRITMMPEDEKLLVEEFQTAFHRCGIKATHARLVIARYLAHSPRALTISEIVEGVVSEQLDRATVNRVLHIFANVGFVSLQRLSNRSAKDEAKSESDATSIFVNVPAGAT